MSGVKKCPACAEEILAAAIRCRYCGTVVASGDWHQAVERWRSLPEPKRAEYWANLSIEQQQQFRAILPEGAMADQPAKARTVVVGDIDMPFGSMVGFMVKWALASIPAIVILLLLGAMAAGVFGGFLAAIAEG